MGATVFGKHGGWPHEIVVKGYNTSTQPAREQTSAGVGDRLADGCAEARGGTHRAAELVNLRKPQSKTVTRWHSNKLK